MCNPASSSALRRTRLYQSTLANNIYTYTHNIYICIYTERPLTCVEIQAARLLCCLVCMFRHRLSFGCVDLFICYDFVEAGRRAARHVGHTSFAWFMVWARVARLASLWPLLGAWPLVGLSWVALARLVLCWALLGCLGPLLGLS